MREPLRPRVDNALYALFTRKWSKAKIKAYPRALELQAKNTHGRTVEAFQMIDVKATGMLSHVSMMIAGLGITAPLLAQHPVEEAVIVAEICVYLLIAIGCLRCLSALAPDDIQDDPESSVARELIIRQELYGFCNRLAIRFTILVFFSLPIMLWWDPSKFP